MDITNYVKPELAVLILVLYLVGIAFKKSAIKDKLIPLLLGAIGVILAVIWVLATSAIATYQDALMAVFVAITQGILCAGASVYVNQIGKQSKK